MDVKYKAGSTIGYTLPPGKYENSDIILMLKSLLLKQVKLKITIDDIRLKSNLSTNETIRFTEKCFFHVLLGLTQSDSGEIGDIKGFVQLTPGTYKSDKHVNITGVDKFLLQCKCKQGSIVNGIRKTILYSFVFSSPPVHKIYKEPRIELFKKINKSVLSHFIFYLEDDDHKAVDFNGKTVSFTCQLIKI